MLHAGRGDAHFNLSTPVQRQEDLYESEAILVYIEFQANLIYIVGSRTDIVAQ